MNRRQAVWFAIAAVLIAGLLYGFWPRARPVEAATVQRLPLQVTVEEEGRTRVIDRFVVSAPVAGFVRRVVLKVGDPVTRGKPLVLLDPPRSGVLDPRARAEAQARVAAAEAALRAAEQEANAAQNEAELARIEFERIQQLAEKKLVSRTEEDQARTRLRSAMAAQRSAEFAVQVAQHERDAARTTLKYTDPQAQGQGAPVAITSPVNGVVLKLYRESEGMVNTGQPLLEIGDPTALEVAVDVLSADAVRIAPGMRVIFERWGGGDDLEGRVRRVEPVGFTEVSALGVEEQRVNVIADFTSPAEQWARLGDGYRVEAKFVLWEGKDVLQIPTSALFRSGEGWAVFKIANGRAQRQEVTVGHRNGLSAQVAKGLAQGDQVITHPDETIREGVAVEPIAR